MLRFITILLIFLQFSTSIPSGRILGGNDVNIEDFPYQLSISNNLYGHYCGAVLISPIWALTTATCAEIADSDYMYNYFDVDYGYILSNATNITEGVRSDIEEVTIHPDYDFVTLKNNIALMKLSHKMECINCKPINLSEESPKIGDLITISGWGVTDQKNFTIENEILQAVDLPVINKTICDTKFYNLNNENTFCAGFVDEVDLEKNACYYDQGGPAVIGDVLVGVVSKVQCGEPIRDRFPGVYLDVSLYLGWIREYVEDLQ